MRTKKTSWCSRKGSGDVQPWQFNKVKRFSLNNFHSKQFSARFQLGSNSEMRPIKKIQFFNPRVFSLRATCASASSFKKNKKKVSILSRTKQIEARFTWSKSALCKSCFRIRKANQVFRTSEDLEHFEWPLNFSKTMLEMQLVFKPKLELESALNQMIWIQIQTNSSKMENTCYLH